MHPFPRIKITEVRGRGKGGWRTEVDGRKGEKEESEIFIYLHQVMKLETLSRAKKVPLLAAAKYWILLAARIGPAAPEVIERVSSLLRA